jgi:hypothetical protein
METSTSNLKLKGFLLAATGLVLSVGNALAGDYPFFPDTSLGTTYYWKNYRVETPGKLTYLGVITNTIAGTQLLGGHTYVVVNRRNAGNQRLTDIVFRRDDELCGTLDGDTEDSLVVAWKGEPRVGQTWSRGAVQTVVRKREDVEAGGVLYRDCLVMDRLDDGQMTNRSWFSREAGWVKSAFYRNGREASTGYRTTKEAAYAAD